MTAITIHPDRAAYAKVWCDLWTPPFSREESLGFYAEDGVMLDRSFGVEIRGHQALGDYFQQIVDAVPEMNVTVINHFSAPTFEVIEWQWAATFRKDLPVLGMEQSLVGKSFDINGISVVSFGADGRITHEVDHWNKAELLRQIGLLG
ncbi:nuclear transport factor 2 family protein [Streptomyces telluris]|uniref:Nuclear transport factor 2 family protein n=1 Tax=Streptomyces telluris TaxID=2720021 RepID=A0A9X2LM76_9ACTN|nr:nuclear transport factor 2 family protein [Streptomyces telluris]MCQ8774381.1 nuclear transport factor 2 family protein [Streptomyces telluris]NJP83001.1 SnoaL-like domain-containing protein [Streptomyces telluris]